MKKKYLDIIDPIHDFIRVYNSELKIIDSPIFQRLRRIRQLTGAHLTYPSAQHTRFEHSLGVMHIAGNAAQTLKEKGVLKTDDIDNIRLAALLHDIGHGPFSHLFEEVLQQKKKISHEDVGKQLILKTEIGDILSKSGFDKQFITSEETLALSNELKLLQESVSQSAAQLNTMAQRLQQIQNTLEKFSPRGSFLVLVNHHGV